MQRGSTIEINDMFLDFVFDRPIYFKYLGWKGFTASDSKGRISTILKGYGSATLEFGNCASGTVQLFIKGKMIDSISGNGKKKIEFDFCDGDNLMLQHVNGGIILFNDFQYDCVTNTIDNEGWFFQRVFFSCFDI